MNLRCISLRGHRALALAGLVLSSADQIQITFRVRWPLRLFCPARCLRIHLAGFPSSSGGQAAGPAQATLEQLVPVSETHWNLKQSTTGRVTWARIQLRTPALLRFKSFELQICTNNGGRLLRRIGFEVLNEARAQWVRLQQLRTEAQQLWIRTGAQWRQGNVVSESSDSVVAQFTTAASDLSRLLPPCQTWVTWTLASESRQTPLGSRPIHLGTGAQVIKTDPVPIQDRDLFPGPGSYRVFGRVGGKEIASLSFRVLSYAEWLQQIKVQCVDLVTETADGQIKIEKGAGLRRGVHLAFRPCIRITAPVPSPQKPLRCTVRLTRGEMLLRTEELSVRLNQTSQRVWLARYELQELGARAKSRHVRLTLTILMDNEVKIAWPIILLPPERLTNFEGQLNCNSSNLPIDEDAYSEILTRLASARERGCSAPG